tara:strand:+ start:5025 stop:6062 length:1038 start_codon:yes stop_codon:yes gene_type:complete
MPDVEIVKLKLRRGTDTQRQSVILEQGELGYTTDRKRVWVGDGFTAGGHVAGNLVFAPLTSSAKTSLADAVQNDLVYENNLLYQLSGTDSALLSSWAFIGSQTDTASISYDVNNKLHVVTGAISATSLNSDVVATNGGITLNPVQGLSAAVDGTSIRVNSTTGQLSVLGAPVPSSCIGNGLSGGGGDQIGVFTSSSFGLPGGQLSFLNAPCNTVCACAIVASTVTNGLIVDNNANTLGMATIGAGISKPFNTTSYDQFGRVTSTSNTITQNFSGINTGGAGVTFYGDLIDTTTAGRTVICATSGSFAADTGSNVAATTVCLCSAGFITIDTGTCGKLAIPVFNYC